MSSLYQKRGYYYYQRYLTDEEGNRERINKSLRTKDADEAKQLKNRWDEYYDNIEANPDFEPTDIKRKIDEYLDHRQKLYETGQLSKKTVDGEKSSFNVFKRWIDDTFDVLYLHEVDTDTLRRFKVARLDEVKTTSVHSNLLHIQSFFSWLHRHQEIDSHPFEHLQMPKAEKRAMDAVPTMSEWRTIKDTIKQTIDGGEFKRLHICMWIICRTGMRLTEAVELRWERGSDLGNTYSYIEGTTAVINLKRKLRRVPLNHIWDEIQLLDRHPDNPYLFYSPQREGKPVAPSGWSFRISEYLTDLGYPKYSAHALRHAFITEMVLDGHNMGKIARLVGHSTQAITDRYTHIRTDDFNDMF